MSHSIASGDDSSTHGYRVRGVTTSRLEGLSDAVFAFSATLLVVSLEVPETFHELTANLAGFIGFGCSFALLMMIWTAHHGFFRRYPLQDVGTIAINSVLLFLVLFYVYPMKFLTSLVTGYHLGIEDVRTMVGSNADITSLMLLYSGGFIAVYFCIVLLYSRALKKSKSLGLDALEVFDGQTMIRHYGIYIAVGLLSVALTLGNIGSRVGLQGWIYAFIGPLCFFHGRRRLGRRKVLAGELEGA